MGELKDRFTKYEIERYTELCRILHELLYTFIELYPKGYTAGEFNNNRSSRKLIHWNDKSDESKEGMLNALLNRVSYSDKLISWDLGDSYVECHGQYDYEYYLYDKIAVTLIEETRDNISKHYEGISKYAELKNERELKNNSKEQ